MMLSGDYRTRPVSFLELWEIGDWKLKAYGITYESALLEQSLVDASRQITIERLRVSASGTNHYGVGFVGIHQAKTGNFVFVDWWANENELHHHVFVSSSTEPTKLEYNTPIGPAACTWDLFLIGHERDAWVKHVLKHSEAPDLEGYLMDRLYADV